MWRRAACASALALCLGALCAPLALASPPAIGVIRVGQVGTEALTLKAELSTQNEETTYHFEYGPEDCSKSACVQLPAKTEPANSSPVPIEAKLELAPGTRFHARVVAENGDGETPGEDQVFATYVPGLEGLPDNRAYEQASPVKKNAADARGTVVWVKAADDGGAIVTLSSSGLPGGVGGQEIPAYLSSRGESDWSTQGLLPPAALATKAFVRGWLPSLSTVFEEGTNFAEGEDSLFLSRSSADGSLSEVIGHGEGLTRYSYAGSSADGQLVLFESNQALPCCAQALAASPNLYLWDRGGDQISLVGVLNDLKPPASATGAGAVAGPYDWMLSAKLPLAGSATGGGSAGGYYTHDMHAISATGDAVFFTAVASGALYERINPTAAQSPLDGEGKCADPALACTLEVSATQRALPDPLGSRPAALMAATPDGENVFFTSPEELTDDANTGPVQPPPAIQRAKVSGPPVEESLPLIARGVAKDSEYLYWVNPVQSAIARAKLNGAEENPTFIPIPKLKVKNTKGEDEEVDAKPQYVTVDSGHVYWTSEGKGERKEGVIGRADIDGNPLSVEPEWIKETTQPKGIAVDGEYAYWANSGAGSTNEGAIWKAKKSDGEVVSNGFVPGIGGTERPAGVALDASHIYMTQNDSGASIGEVLRAELADGSNLKFKSLGTEAQLRGIAVGAGHIYWASQRDEAIGRSNLELEEIQKEFIPLTGKPIGLATDGADLRWSVNGESVPNPGNDLYRYRAEDESLEDLTPDATDVDGAEVKGVLGASGDGKRVYFVANADLDGAGEGQAGNCLGRFDSVNSLFVFSGHCDLYLAEEGAPGGWSTRFVAPLDANGDCEASDAANWLGRGGGVGGACEKMQRTALTSADGNTLLFRSQEQLSEYDNEGQPELYRYQADSEELGCVSCDPTGAAPTGAATLGGIGLSALAPERDPAYTLSRNLSADGNRVFFESTDPLVVNDTNGEDGCETEGAALFPFPSCLDAYEWEAEGTGSCEADVRAGGCLYLLSTGTDPHGSFFADASLDGSDAFIATRAAGLVGQDQDKLQDVFDLRVGGGLAAQSKGPEPVCESLDACHGPQSAQPTPESPASANIGPGNKKHPRKPAKKHRKHKKHRQAKPKTGGKGR
jgi:hypothetical protein